MARSESPVDQRRGALEREDAPRLTIYLVAGLITLIVALVTAGLVFWALTGMPGVAGEARLEGALRPGAAEFEQYRRQLPLSNLAATEASRAAGAAVLELTALVRNETGRALNGLELRGAMIDSQGAAIRERVVVVIPAQQSVLEPDETMSVRLLLEGVSAQAGRADVRLEVVGLRFE